MSGVNRLIVSNAQKNGTQSTLKQTLVKGTLNVAYKVKPKAKK